MAMSQAQDAAKVTLPFSVLEAALDEASRQPALAAYAQARAASCCAQRDKGAQDCRCASTLCADCLHQACSSMDCMKCSFMGPACTGHRVVLSVARALAAAGVSFAQGVQDEWIERTQQLCGKVLQRDVFSSPAAEAAVRCVHRICSAPSHMLHLC